MWIYNYLKIKRLIYGNSRADQWLGLSVLTARGQGSILGRGTKILQAALCTHTHKKRLIYKTKQQLKKWIRLWVQKGSPVSMGRYELTLLPSIPPYIDTWLFVTYSLSCLFSCHYPHFLCSYLNVLNAPWPNWAHWKLHSFPHTDVSAQGIPIQLTSRP